MEPAFYSVEVGVLVNLDVWKGLNDAQKKVLNDAALWLEGLDSENEALIKSERDRQTKAGIAADRVRRRRTARRSSPRPTTSAGQSVIKRSPENGAEAAAAVGELSAGSLVSRPRCSAKRCVADPGPLRCFEHAGSRVCSASRRAAE